MESKQEHIDYILGWIASVGIQAESVIVITFPRCGDKQEIVEIFDDYFAINASNTSINLELNLECKDCEVWMRATTTHDVISSAFVRGVFDATGTISKKHKTSTFLFENPMLQNNIAKFMGIAINTSCDALLQYVDTNALDFLSKLYDTSTIGLSRNKAKYLKMIGQDSGVPLLRFTKVLQNAVVPTKSRASDIGYDLTILHVHEHTGTNTWLFETGLSIHPPFGWYIDIIARSSLSKSGYFITNGLGVIDPPYRGTLKISLTKHDLAKTDLVLPARIGQMVMRQAVHYVVQEVPTLTNTERGEQGFGSSG